MADRRDPNLPATRSRAWIIGVGAAAIALGALYFLVSMGAQPGTTLDGSPEAPPVEGAATTP